MVKDVMQPKMKQHRTFKAVGRRPPFGRLASDHAPLNKGEHFQKLPCAFLAGKEGRAGEVIRLGEVPPSGLANDPEISVPKGKLHGSQPGEFDEVSLTLTVAPTLALIPAGSIADHLLDGRGKRDGFTFHSLAPRFTRKRKRRWGGLRNNRLSARRAMDDRSAPTRCIKPCKRSCSSSVSRMCR